MIQVRFQIVLPSGTTKCKIFWKLHMLKSIPWYSFLLYNSFLKALLYHQMRMNSHRCFKSYVLMSHVPWKKKRPKRQQLLKTHQLLSFNINFIQVLNIRILLSWTSYSLKPKSASLAHSQVSQGLNTAFSAKKVLHWAFLTPSMALHKSRADTTRRTNFSRSFIVGRGSEKTANIAQATWESLTIFN